MANEMQPNCIYCRYYRSKKWTESYYRPVCVLAHESPETCKSFIERPAEGDVEIAANAIPSIS